MKPNLPKKLSSKTPIVLVLVAALLGFLGGAQYQKSITPSIPSQPSLPSQATVSRVVDGDTLELSTGQHVRLYGVSAPDQGEPFYQEAKDFTTKLTLNQTINLEYEQGYEQDKFGRLLTYVIVNGQNLNIELVKQGLAEVKIYQKRRKLIYQDQLLEAQAQAKENKLGIWSD